MRRNLILSSLLTLLKILKFDLFRTFSLNNSSRLVKIQGLKYIYVLSEFKHTEFFTSRGAYLLNTTLEVPSVEFSEAGLDRAKFGFN